MPSFNVFGIRSSFLTLAFGRSKITRPASLPTPICRNFELFSTPRHKRPTTMQWSPLFHIILRFKQFSVAISTDIEKKFEQIWRLNIETISKSFGENTHRILLNITNWGPRSRGRFQFSSSRTRCCSFVILHRQSLTKPEWWAAIHMAHDIDRMLSARHFRLRKWKSNGFAVVEPTSNVPGSFTELAIDQFLIFELRIKWDSAFDELHLLYHLRVKPNAARLCHLHSDTYKVSFS